MTSEKKSYKLVETPYSDATSTTILRTAMEDVEMRKLITAVQTGDVVQVRHLVDKGMMTNQFSGQPLVYTCLPMAENQKQIWQIIVEANRAHLNDPKLGLLLKNVCDVERLEFLLKLGADPNQVFECSYNCRFMKNIIVEAIKRRAPITSISLLLAYGADPNMPDNISNTPLEEALRVEQGTQLVQVLLEAGSDPNFDQSSSLQSALHTAVRGGQMHALQTSLQIPQMIRNKAGDPHFMAKCRARKRPYSLTGAASHSLTGAATRSLTGAAPHRLTGAAPHSLTGAGPHSWTGSINTDNVRLLIEHGANVNLRDHCGLIPLMYAVKLENSKPVTDMLIQAGSSLKLLDKQQNSVLHHAVSNTSTLDLSDPQIVQDLVHHGADLSSINNRGETPLMSALLFINHEATIEALINAETALAVNQHNKYTVLHYAAEYGGTVDTIKSLLNNGARINKVNLSGKTALMLAITVNNCKVVDILIERGADLRIQDAYENTALHYAAIHGTRMSTFNRMIAGNEELLRWNNREDKSVFELAVHSFVLDKHMDSLSNLLDNTTKFCNQEHMETLLKQAQSVFLHDRFRFITSVLEYPQVFELLLRPPYQKCSRVFTVMAAWNCFVFKKSGVHNRYNCNLFTYFVSKIGQSDMTSQVSAAKWIQCLDKLESCGLELMPTDVTCVSPVIVLLLAIHNRRAYTSFQRYLVDNTYEEKVLEVLKYLFNKFRTSPHSAFWSVHQLQTDVYNKYPVPDTLYLAAMAGCVGIVQYLLQFWPHPPLALLIHLIPLQYDKDFFDHILLRIYPSLAAGGPLVRGSLLYQQVDKLLQGQFRSLLRIKLHFQIMHGVNGEVPSLLSLCRVVIGSCLPAGLDLPQRVQDLGVPRQLQDYLIQNYFDTNEIEQQLTDIELPQLGPNYR